MHLNETRNFTLSMAGETFGGAYRVRSETFGNLVFASCGTGIIGTRDVARNNLAFGVGLRVSELGVATVEDLRELGDGGRPEIELSWSASITALRNAREFKMTDN